ncbi:MAG: cobalamin biosynthesis protein CbiX [Verrucomicrobia bacterium]|nr:cobalamin biosynthesis protein CbiX [Verrucomicrobiota bacterium]
MVVQLIDNGSLRPESWLNLQRLATASSRRFGLQVHGISLLHSDRLDPNSIGGQPARIWEPTMRAFLKAGEREFFIQPFFIGPTAAITQYMPERLQLLQQEFPDLKLRYGDFLFSGEDTDDGLLTSIVCQRIKEALGITGWMRPRVVLVDHGSPLPEVTFVRNYIAGQLSVLLRNEVHSVAVASMERREGDLYRFNDPLLADRLDQDGYAQSEVIIAMLFLSPGRHAGPDGDVEQICKEARLRNPRLATHCTGLLGTHPLMEELLYQRIRRQLITTCDA